LRIRARNVFNKGSRARAIPKNNIENEYYGITVTTPYNEDIIVESRKRLGILVSRENFDMCLINSAIKNGVIFKDETFVKKISIKHNLVKVYTKNNVIYETKYVIGADGPISTVARSVNLFKKPNPRLSGLALQTTIPVTDVSEIVNPRFIHTFLGFLKFGYGWIFPYKQTLNVGIGGQMQSLNNPIELARLFIKKIPKLNSLKIPKFRPHILPIGGIKKNICTKRVFLVGDAAGCVDAMTGEGIYYAMKSGKIAAKVITSSSSEKNIDYWSKFKSEIWKNLRASTIMALISGLVPGLSGYQLTDPSISKHLIATTIGEEKYAQYYYKFLIDLIKKSPEYVYQRIF